MTIPAEYVRCGDLIGPALDWAVAKALGGDISLQRADCHTTLMLPCVTFTKNPRYIDDHFLLDSQQYQALAKEYRNEGGLCLRIKFWRPSTNWDQGGPIIEREGICLMRGHGGSWIANKLAPTDDEVFMDVSPAPLAAAMRCFVNVKLGDEIYIPKELLQ